MTLRWYASGLLLAAAIGWLAARGHVAGWAPVGIVSLAVGIGLGFGTLKLADLVGVVCRQRLIAGALVFALATIFAEHAWLYRDFRRQWREARDHNPQVAMFRSEQPWSPAEYLRHEATGARIALWGLDAVLICIGAMGVVMLRRTSDNGAADQGEFVVADDANPD